MKRGIPDDRTRQVLGAIAVLLLLLVASVPSVPVDAAQRALAAQPTVLYRADWSHGLAGWTKLGDPGWSVNNGVLTYAGSGNGELFAPYQLPTHGNIAVEAQIEQVSRFKNRQADRGYGVVANGDRRPWSGVAGGFFYGDQLYSPQSDLYWDGDSVSGTDVALHDSFNRFRLERRGEVYSVVENGINTVHFTISDARGTRLGLFSRDYRIRIRSLVVLNIPPTNPSGSSLGRNPTLPPLKLFNLSTADVPSGFDRIRGHYYPNTEIARGRQVSVQSLNQLGRLMSYEASFRHATTSLYDDIVAEIVAYTTPAAAHVDTQYLIHAYHQNSAAPGYLQSVPGSFGEEDDLSQYRYTAYDGSQYDVYDLIFRRGRYRVSLELDFPYQSIPTTQSIALLTRLGHVIDDRLKKS